jgi:hypothetical protein
MTDVFLAGATAPEELKVAFLEACGRPTDIHEHLTVLRDTASGQKHVTEMGTGTGQSTLAWLLVQPEKLVCYDWGFQDCVPTLKRLRGRTDFRFYVADSRLVEIEPTDVLFLDTRHNYDQVRDELAAHARKVRSYILIHDTTTFADHGEDGRPPGVWPAITEFLAAHPEWVLLNRFAHNNGLTILGRSA